MASRLRAGLRLSRALSCKPHPSSTPMAYQSAIAAGAPALPAARGHAASCPPPVAVVARATLSLAQPPVAFPGSSSVLFRDSVARSSAAFAPSGSRPYGRTSDLSTKGSDEDLVAALTSEIEHEKDSYEAPEEVAKGPPKPWKVKANPGAAELVLHRSFQGEDIQVLVSESDEPSEDYDTEEPEEGVEKVESEEGEEMEVEPPFLPVRASITKKAADGTLHILEFDLAIEGEDSEWVLEAVRLLNPGAPEGSIAYTGPDYFTLDPALQDELGTFLKRRGFTNELGTFIRGSLEDKEQQEYVSWLGRLRSFVSLKSK